MINLEAAAEKRKSFYPEGHKGYPGVANKNNPKLVYPKDYVCHFCKKSFKDFKIFQSKLYESQPMRYDLRKFYTGFMTEWYDIITCPHCYFSTFHTYYATPKPIQKKLIEQDLANARKSVALDFSSERCIDFVFTSHYLALICAPAYLSQGKQLIAKLWANLSWLYEEIGDEEMERKAAENAYLAYETLYTEVRMNPLQEQAVCMAAAGMMYRAGLTDNNDINKYLYNVKTIKMGEKSYVRMAEDLIETLKPAH